MTKDTKLFTPEYYIRIWENQNQTITVSDYKETLKKAEEYIHKYLPDPESTMDGAKLFHAVYADIQ